MLFVRAVVWANLYCWVEGPSTNMTTSLAEESNSHGQEEYESQLQNHIHEQARNGLKKQSLRLLLYKSFQQFYLASLCLVARKASILEPAILDLFALNC